MHCSSPECKDFMRKYEELNSRSRHLQYAAEEYDSRKGKGAFRKKFPGESKLLDTLTEQKIKMTAQHARSAHRTSESTEASDTIETAGVPVF
jgi:hypothetical protein